MSPKRDPYELLDGTTIKIIGKLWQKYERYDTEKCSVLFMLKTDAKTLNRSLTVLVQGSEKETVPLFSNMEIKEDVCKRVLKE